MIDVNLMTAWRKDAEEYADKNHEATYSWAYAYDVRLAELAAKWAAEQQASKPLTDEQIKEIRYAAKADPRCETEHWFVLMARAIEQAHGITAATKEQANANT